MHPEYKLSSYQAKKLSGLVKRRRLGEPAAYLLGYKDFYGLRFKVSRNVLIPRPESEWLVERAVKSVKQMALGGSITNFSILDVGTGSGAIIISIAKQLSSRLQVPGYRLIGSDISAAALALARVNAWACRAKIRFVESDLLQNIKFTPDIIVANLPYVPKKIYDLRFKNLRFEPKEALVDPEKDFDSYHRLLKQAAALPSRPRLILLEIDPGQKKLLPGEVKKYLPGAGVKFYRDLAGLWRYAEIKFAA